MSFSRTPGSFDRHDEIVAGLVDVDRRGPGAIRRRRPGPDPEVGVERLVDLRLHVCQVVERVEPLYPPSIHGSRPLQVYESLVHIQADMRVVKLIDGGDPVMVAACAGQGGGEAPLF